MNQARPSAHRAGSGGSSRLITSIRFLRLDTLVLPPLVAVAAGRLI